MAVVLAVAPADFIMLLLVWAATQYSQATLFTATVMQNVLLEAGNVKCANPMQTTKT